MGLFDFIKTQLLEVIEWTDDSSNTLVYRFPVLDKEIKMGAQLIVRESQVAIFVNEGQIADVFQPGRHTLTTANMPVLTKIKSWKYGFNSPFKTEVYFVNTKQFTNQKWGTPNPIMMRDQDFGMLRFRAFGVFSFRVNDAVKFLKELFGTNKQMTTESVTLQFKKIITSSLADIVAESQIPALDLAMSYDEIGEQGIFKLKPKFAEYGFDLTTLVIENISLPKEVEEVLDKRTKMGILGDMGHYTQYQAAEALRDVAQQEDSGFLKTGMSLGAGAAFTGMMANAFNQLNPQNYQQQNQTQQAQQSQPQPQPHPQPQPQNQTYCGQCGSGVQEGFKFCGECGTPVVSKPKCTPCNKEFSANMKFCPECGSKLT